MSDSDPNRSARARDVFSEFVEAHDASPDSVDFDSVLAAHPDLRPLLENLHASWMQLEAAFGDSSGARTEGVASPVVEARLERRPGALPSGERYRDLREIARGGMGRVVATLDEELGRVVARKTLIVDAGRGPLADPRRLWRFLEEARVTAQLDHPNIIPLFDVGTDDDGYPFFTMSLVDGISLADAFAMHRAEHSMSDAAIGDWSRPRLLDVLIDVCEAVAYAHTQGVIHRDLKPANVMLGRFGEVHVIDWGLVAIRQDSDIAAEREGEAGRPRAPRAIESLRRQVADEIDDVSILSHSGDVVGTPAYMSPEQADGQIGEAVDGRVDVYSIGAMMYELLAGMSPYGDSPSGVAALTRLRAGPPAPIRDRALPAALVAICTRAMARDPQDRYPTAAALRDDLRAYRQQRVVQAHGTGALREAVMWISRNRALTSALAAGAVGAVLAIVMLWSAYSDADDARQLADERLVLADRGIATASESVDRLLSRFGSGFLLQMPGGVEEANAVLRDAVRLQHELCELQPESVSARMRLARAYNHVAVVAITSAQYDRARELATTSLELTEELFEEQLPRDGVTRLTVWTAWASDQNLIASSYLQQGQYALVQKEMEGAFAQLAKNDLLRDSPDDAASRDLLGLVAGLYDARGTALGELGSLDEARADFDRVRELWLRIQRVAGLDEEVLNGLLRAAGMAVTLSDMLGDAAGADSRIAALRAEIAELEGEVREHPMVLLGLAEFYRHECEYLTLAKRFDDAGPSAEGLLELRASLIPQHADRYPHSTVAHGLAVVARLRAAEGRTDEAVVLLAEARELLGVLLADRPDDARGTVLLYQVGEHRLEIARARGDWRAEMEIGLQRCGAQADWLRLDGADALLQLLDRAAGDGGTDSGPDAEALAVCRQAASEVVRSERARQARGETSSLPQYLEQPHWKLAREDPAFR